LPRRLLFLSLSHSPLFLLFLLLLFPHLSLLLTGCPVFPFLLFAKTKNKNRVACFREKRKKTREKRG